MRQTDLGPYIRTSDAVRLVRKASVCTCRRCHQRKDALMPDGMCRTCHDLNRYANTFGGFRSAKTGPSNAFGITVASLDWNGDLHEC